MAFTPINNAEISTGEPCSYPVNVKIKDNFDDHESRISGLELTTLKFKPIEFHLYGDYGESGNMTDNLGFYIVNFNIDLFDATLLIHQAGTSGTTEIDLQYKRGANPFASIFTVGGRPKVAFGEGDYAKSTGEVFAVTGLLAGDIIKLSTVQAQGGSPDGCSVFLDMGATL